MLILGRRRFERVRIGDDIYVSVQEIHPGVVRLGFEAPKNVVIVRTELLGDDRRAGETPAGEQDRQRREDGVA